MSISEGDLVFVYLADKRQLMGPWQAVGYPFYDSTPLWTGNSHPFRCRIKPICQSSRTLPLEKILMHMNANKLKAYAWYRQESTNAIFSISQAITRILLFELRCFVFDCCISQSLSKTRSNENEVPSSLFKHIHRTKSLMPRYESSVMALLIDGLLKQRFRQLFAPYIDFVAYNVNGSNLETDIILINEIILPTQQYQVEYQIIEVKPKCFHHEALMQIIGYGKNYLSLNPEKLSLCAVALNFPDEVLAYAHNKNLFDLKCFAYSVDSSGDLMLQKL